MGPRRRFLRRRRFRSRGRWRSSRSARVTAAFAAGEEDAPGRSIDMVQSLTNRVKTCRTAKGWSQDELADRAGISAPPSVQRPWKPRRLVPHPTTARSRAWPPHWTAASKTSFGLARQPPAKQSGPGRRRGKRAVIGARRFRGVNSSTRSKPPASASRHTMVFAAGVRSASGPALRRRTRSSWRRAIRQSDCWPITSPAAAFG